ncbi:ATP-binding protein [Thiobaca trueperi]|nr:ATP-binding protein [Thiobaca trueperi]
MAHSLQPHRRGLLLAALMLLVVIGWLAVFGVTLWSLHDKALDDGFADARMHARNVEDHLTKTLQVIELGADSLPPDGGHASTGTLNQSLAVMLRPSPFLRSLSLLNPDGRVIASSDPRNVGLPINLHGFYPEAGLDWPQLRIGTPWHGRDLGDARPCAGEPAPPSAPGFIPVMRPVELKDQPGWWLAALNPDDFINHFSELLPVDEGRVQLLRYDGMLLLSSHPDDIPGRSDQAGQVPNRLEQQEFGDFEQRLSDGTQTLTAYRASSRFPVVIAVHLDRKYILGQWLADVRGLSMIVLPILAALSVATLLFWRRHQRLEQQRAELERQRRLTSSVFDASSDAIMLTTPSGEILSTNPAFEHMTGYSGDEVRGRNPRLLASGQHDAAFYRALWNAVIETGHWQGEIIDRRKDGSLYTGLLTINAVRDDAGRIQHCVGVTSDMTERKRYEAELLAAKERAEAAALAKTTFLATMSHELRTPMNGILGMTDILLRSELNDKQRRQIGIVKSSAESLLTILADILDYSRIEAHGITLKPSPFDPVETIQVVLALFAPHADKKSLTLRAETLEPPPGMIVADPVRFRQILTNLVSNAIKFTHDGGISVRVWSEPANSDHEHAMLVVTVMDTGIGIPSALHESIFDAFVQVDGSHSRSYGGTGLGLAISRRLAETMGGTLGVASTPGLGSCFTLRIRVIRA